MCKEHTRRRVCRKEWKRKKMKKYKKKKTELKKKANIPTPKSIHKCSNQQPEKRK